MPTITLRGLTKDYGNGVKAVDRLDLVIPDGSFMCLLGPSGCGKTTTLRMIAGLEQPTAGEIEVGDRFLDSPATGRFVPAERRNMGLVFQSYALWPHMTVAGNTEFGLRMRKVPSAQRSQRVRDVLEMLQIGDLAERYPSQLSGGQQQRVSLARMLAVNPEVLLLDEPLSNLDARLRLEMRAELKRIHDELATTIVFVTHDQFEAMTLGTHVAVMDGGLLQQMATPMEIYRRPANLTVARFVGNPPMNLCRYGDRGSPLGDAWATWLGGRPGPQRPTSGWIGVRPEAFVLGPRTTPGSATWHGDAIVESVLPTGPSWIVRALIHGVPVFIETYRDPDVERDSRIDCSVDMGAFHAFGPDDGRTGNPYDEPVDVADRVVPGPVLPVASA